MLQWEIEQQKSRLRPICKIVNSIYLWILFYALWNLINLDIFITPPIFDSLCLEEKYFLLPKTGSQLYLTLQWSHRIICYPRHNFCCCPKQLATLLNLSNSIPSIWLSETQSVQFQPYGLPISFITGIWKTVCCSWGLPKLLAHVTNCANVFANNISST